jgi:hypothetical protein
MPILEQMRKVVMIITFTVLCIVFVFNIYICFRADTDTWFTRCNECERQGGKEKCGSKCCVDCSKADEAFFYVNRVYTMGFTAIAGVSELRPDPLVKWFRMCGYYFARGPLGVFIGLLCVQSGLSDPAGFLVSEILGWAMVGVGCVNFCLGFFCQNDTETEDGGDADESAPVADRNPYRDYGTKSSAAKPAAKERAGSQYNYGGESYNYNHGGPGGNAAGPGAI